MFLNQYRLPPATEQRVYLRMVNLVRFHYGTPRIGDHAMVQTRARESVPGKQLRSTVRVPTLLFDEC